eukprot:CAMPEP_0197840182 /NCGR_PEP_ID=MMETSP1437-20131217/45452_1 /TAXON_ID=49252 ORGANISM="Eucampia antarctica, Strain CCMP1452" /NCGR_SAMPLE_ID=MMETSP1437 /ASSEMBLY_ACC=CAM_ASM_001096 /LENGTH=180 /DNA_ID=CAMNT_0043449747 /DNA_START=11 /DNA_END=554 /DNA_ORIENTATION=-
MDPPGKRKRGRPLGSKNKKKETTKKAKAKLAATADESFEAALDHLASPNNSINQSSASAVIGLLDVSSPLSFSFSSSSSSILRTQKKRMDLLSSSAEAAARNGTSSSSSSTTVVEPKDNDGEKNGNGNEMNNNNNNNNNTNIIEEEPFHIVRTVLPNEYPLNVRNQLLSYIQKHHAGRNQ